MERGQRKSPRNNRIEKLPACTYRTSRYDGGAVVTESDVRYHATVPLIRLDVRWTLRIPQPTFLKRFFNSRENNNSMYPAESLFSFRIRGWRASFRDRWTKYCSFSARFHPSMKDARNQVEQRRFFIPSIESIDTLFPLVLPSPRDSYFCRHLISVTTINRAINPMELNFAAAVDRSLSAGLSNPRGSTQFRFTVSLIRASTIDTCLRFILSSLNA